MKERIQTINEIYDKGKYFFEEPESYDEKGIVKYWTDDLQTVFKSYLEKLKSELWGRDNLENHLRNFTDSQNINAGKLIHIIRLAITGTTASPGIFELEVESDDLANQAAAVCPAAVISVKKLD